MLGSFIQHERPFGFINLKSIRGVTYNLKEFFAVDEYGNLLKISANDYHELKKFKPHRILKKGGIVYGVK